MASMRMALTLAALMCATSAATYFAKPSLKAADRIPKIQLDTAIPKQFGQWREEPARSAAIVNPQTQQLLDKLYSQTLERTYVDAQGYRVMLSLAYGDDQRGGLRRTSPRSATRRRASRCTRTSRPKSRHRSAKSPGGASPPSWARASSPSPTGSPWLIVQSRAGSSTAWPRSGSA